MDYKRSLDREEEDGGSKRFRHDDAMDGGADSGLVFKLLLPGQLTGAVIGKQGVVLKRIMDESGARVRVSLVDEVIPVTGERVCTVVGSLDAVYAAATKREAAERAAAARRLASSPTRAAVPSPPQSSVMPARFGSCRLPRTSVSRSFRPARPMSCRERRHGRLRVTRTSA